jgi:glycosyltransferase involved in cell wall biosynthesis
MKIKVVLDSCFRGMISGWPTRYIGLISELYANHELHIFAPGNTELFKSYFPAANVCKSTSEKHNVNKLTLLKYAMSIISPKKIEIYLPEFRFYPEYNKLLSLDNAIYELILYFGLSSYVFYCNNDRSIPKICDVCDSALRHRDSHRTVTDNWKLKIVNTIDMCYIRRIKRKFIDKDLVITAITDLDVAYIKKVLKNNRVVTIANGVSTPKFKVSEDIIDDKILSNQVLFCGSLDYGPNVYSLMYILNEIWPVLKDAYPELHFHIVGRNPITKLLDKVNSSERVQLFKNVPDVFLHYKNAKLFLSPMFNGGGMKNKILEALISGTPVVTNREGMVGIEMKSGVHGYLGESVKEFINGVNMILKADKETYRKMVYSCEILGAKYSWKSSADALEKVIKSVSQ